MESEQNRDRMAEERQQVEQARENVRQASEALEEGRLSQAVNEGARAKSAVGRGPRRPPQEVVRPLRPGHDRDAPAGPPARREANQLAEAARGQATNKPSALAPRPRQLAGRSVEGLEGQQKQLDPFLDRMRDTVQQAEETEPLLAKQLFETVNKANQQAIPDALKQAEQLADVGINEEAARSARQAGRQGIGQLREGVEKAARSVLGDETAALKRAASELEDLSRQVDREFAPQRRRATQGPLRLPRNE